MRRGRHFWRDPKTGKFHDITEQVRRPRPQKAPSIRCDGIRDTFCHATGRTYNSRSEMMRDIKESGSEVVGWHETLARDHSDIAPGFDDDFEKAANDLRYGAAGELTEYDKHICKEIDDGLER